MANKKELSPDTVKEDKENIKYGRLLSKSLKVFFRDALRISLTNPSQAFFFFKTLNW